MDNNYSRNAVFSRICDDISANHTSVYVSSIYTPKPSSFPAVFIYEIGHFSPSSNVTFMNDDEQWQSTFEVQVITNDTSSRQSKAYALLETIKKSFKSMFYIEISENPVSIQDETTYRLVARFRRTIGGGDTLPSE